MKFTEKGRFQPHINKIVKSHLSPVFYLVDSKLHRNVKAVQNVASKHQRVRWSVDGMNPTLKMQKED